MEKKLTELVDKALSRRSFLAGSGSAAVVTIIAGCGGSTTPTPTPTPTSTSAPTTYMDADYLNFALNLEYLEAEFYLRAATGSGLSSTDTGGATTTVVVPSTTQVPGLTSVQQNYIYEIAQNELDHVRFLRSALGSSAVSRPNLDLMNSFNAAASAAGIGSSFNPFASYEAFLVGAFVFEDVGVTAYLGAAGTLTSKTNLAAAASIMAVEAYHAAEIRTLIIADSVATATKTSTMVTPNDTYVGLCGQDKCPARHPRGRKRNHSDGASRLRATVRPNRIHTRKHHRRRQFDDLGRICTYDRSGSSHRVCDSEMAPASRAADSSQME